MIIGIRFIPAGAGNTSYSRKCLGDDPVYPRWRGEHGLTDDDFKISDGLSPLARGTPPQYASNVRYRRFIPAGAGNTDMKFRRQERYSVYPRWRGEHWRLSATRAWPHGLSPLARGTL
ncbi:FIG01045727: hypothetical protein [Salmonella enterica subsp. enterica serovar Rissen]|nr:FIG01045727: hypothetical protein [Salmonella enterica subsp. enterica serovar Rissen]